MSDRGMAYLMVLHVLFTRCIGLLLFVPFRVDSASYREHQQLHEQLFSNLTPDVPPICEYPTWTNRHRFPVRVQMNLVSLNDIDELSGTMSTVAYLNFTWNDCRLKWNRTHYEMANETNVSQEKIWRPKIILGNPVNKFSALGHKDGVALVRFDGLVRWSVGDYLQTACDLDITHFPFDRQICTIKIAKVAYFNEFRFVPVQEKINTGNLGNNGAWRLINSSIEEEVNGHARILCYNLHLERRSTFFIINLFVPVIVLMLLNSFVFILPAESGERTGFSITCMLAIAVFLTLVSESLPKTSKPLSVLSFILMLCLLLSTVACIMTIISLRLHQNDDSTPVPTYLKRTLGKRPKRESFDLCAWFKQRCTCRVFKWKTKKSSESWNWTGSAAKLFMVRPSQASVCPTDKHSGKTGKEDNLCDAPGSVSSIVIEPVELNKDTAQTKKTPTDNFDNAIAENEKLSSEMENMKWKDVARKFDKICFITVNALTGALGTLYFMISSGRLWSLLMVFKTRR